MATSAQNLLASGIAPNQAAFAQFGTGAQPTAAPAPPATAPPATAQPTATPAQPATAQPPVAAASAGPTIAPIRLKQKKATMLDTLTALSGAMGDPRTNEAGRAHLRELHQMVLDAYKQQLSVWTGSSSGSSSALPTAAPPSTVRRKR